jgi:hypothetical protein
MCTFNDDLEAVRLYVLTVDSPVHIVAALCPSLAFVSAPLFPSRHPQTSTEVLILFRIIFVLQL